MSKSARHVANPRCHAAAADLAAEISTCPSCTSNVYRAVDANVTNHWVSLECHRLDDPVPESMFTLIPALSRNAGNG